MRLSLLRRALPAAALVSLTVAMLAAAQGCSASPSVATSADENSELRELQPSEIVGTTTIGQTSGPIAYESPPRYRALSFTGTAGQTIDAWVRSTDGDAVGFLVDATFKSLATNDDADPSTKDSHLQASLPSTGTYYVVFRERDLEPATFTVSVSDSAADAGADAAKPPPPPPVPGTACPTVDAIASKPCGACGVQQTLCLAPAAPGASATWSDYGACGNELPGGCVPGTTVTEDCGNCGKVTKTCTQYCAFAPGACTGQPANSCVPGTVDYASAGCVAPSTYHHRSCSASCTYGPYSPTCEAPMNANKMTIAPTVGGLVTQQWTLDAAHVGKKLSGMCGAGEWVSTAATYPFVAVEVSNPTAQNATIQVYHSGSGAPLDTVLWIYGDPLPPSDANFGLCKFGAADACLPGDPCGNTKAVPPGTSLDWAGLDNVTIPAGGKILVYSAGYFANVVGNFNLNLKTTSLN